MGNFLRGSIYWCQLNPAQGREQKGRRPLLVISENVFNNSSQTVIGLPITSQSQKAPFPLTHKLSAPLQKKQAWVKMGQVRVLSTNRLGECIDSLPDKELKYILSGFQVIIGADQG